MEKSKKYFLIWLASYGAMLVLCICYLCMASREFTINELHALTSTQGYRLIVAGVVFFWFLPLSIITYRSSRKNNNKIRFLSGAAIVWQTLWLIASAITFTI